MKNDYNGFHDELIKILEARTEKLLKEFDNSETSDLSTDEKRALFFKILNKLE